MVARNSARRVFATPCPLAPTNRYLGKDASLVLGSFPSRLTYRTAAAALERKGLLDAIRNTTRDGFILAQVITHTNSVIAIGDHCSNTLLEISSQDKNWGEF